MKSRRNKAEPNFWAAYADCMLALFLIALMLWILSAGRTIFAKSEDQGVEKAPPMVPKAKYEELEKTHEELEKTHEELKTTLKTRNEEIAGLKKTIENLEHEIEELEKLLQADLADLQKELAELVAEKKNLQERLEDARVNVAELIREKRRLEDKINELEKEIQRLNKKPPIIELGEGNENFRFAPGIAALSENFRNELRNKQFPKLLKNLQDFQVNTIEIIGHTDADPVNGGKGNLDARIPGVFLNNQPVAGLKAGSNADLGLMRALAIREAWLKWTADQKFKVRQFLEPIDIRCYSAAQTVPPDGDVGKELLKRRAPNRAARRIEIRVTFLEK